MNIQDYISYNFEDCVLEEQFILTKKYSMQARVLPIKFKDYYMNLIENLDGLEPTNYHEASQDPELTIAMEQEKIQSLKWRLGSMLIFPRESHLY
jgi:hypothetical protein